MSNAKHITRALGLAGWREKVKSTGKITVNTTFQGEEAEKILEIMDREGFIAPTQAARLLFIAAISSYPEWGANVVARRMAAAETRAWCQRRLHEELVPIFEKIISEVEQSIMEQTAQFEAGEIDLGELPNEDQG